MKAIRLQKALAQAGIASRRAAEELIRRGQVSVNGRVVTTMGEHVNLQVDEVCVNQVPIAVSPRKVYLVFNKPGQCVTTAMDPQGRKTVFDFIPDCGVRLFAVGRLDYDAEGLLLLTNDGPLANRMQHPRYGVSKTYEVKVKGHPDSSPHRFAAGALEECTARPVKLMPAAPATWLKSCTGLESRSTGCEGVGMRS